jgi:hypothetical protein
LLIALSREQGKRKEIVVDRSPSNAFGERRADRNAGEVLWCPSYPLLDVLSVVSIRKR